MQDFLVARNFLNCTYVETTQVLKAKSKTKTKPVPIKQPLASETCTSKKSIIKDVHPLSKAHSPTLT